RLDPQGQQRHPACLRCLPGGTRCLPELRPECGELGEVLLVQPSQGRGHAQPSADLAGLMARDDTFTTIRSEGGLLPTDQLARVREAGSGPPGTAPEAYHLVPGEKLNEAITRSWNRLIGAWRAFADERGADGPG